MSIAHRGSVSEGLPTQRPRVRSVAPSAPRACSMAKEHNAHFFPLSTPCALWRVAVRVHAVFGGTTWGRQDVLGSLPSGSGRNRSVSALGAWKAQSLL